MRRHPDSSRTVAALLTLCALALGFPSAAQEPPPPPPPPAAPGAAPALSPQQLDSLVAPIALYPDPLLSQVLAASTYPLEVVEAARWLQQQSGLQGEALTEAARAQPWDPSVQALVVFPDVLHRLDENLPWTTSLGNAYLDQPQDVMSAVQRLRLQAQERGALVNNQAETVATVPTDTGQPAIDIEPANPEVIYVPSYNPVVIWGPAYYPYPVLYYPSAPEIVFGYGLVMPRYYHDWRGWRGWGWRWNWRDRSPVVNNGFFYRYRYRPTGGVASDTRTSPWAHDPGHRVGVPYRSPVTASRFGPVARGVAPAPPSPGGIRPAPAGRLGEATPGETRDRIGTRDARPLQAAPSRSPFAVDAPARTEIDSSRGRGSMWASPSVRPATPPPRVAMPARPPSPVRVAPAPAQRGPPHR